MFYRTILAQAVKSLKKVEVVLYIIIHLYISCTDLIKKKKKKKEIEMNQTFKRYSPKVLTLPSFEWRDSRPTLQIPVKAHSFALDSSG